MWTRLLTLEQQRKRLYAKLPDNALRKFYSIPFHKGKEQVTQLSYLSVDLETTGFDPQADAILSIGHVDLQYGQIEMGSARHMVVQTHTEISEQSVVIHGITDDISATGQGYQAAVEELLSSLAGKVMLAHHARLELNFIDRACRKLYGGPFITPVVDTLYLALKRLQRRQHSFPAGALRLYKLREEYGLPRYKAHNALTDAIATAELFLAQLAEKGGTQSLKLKDIQLPRNA